MRALLAAALLVVPLTGCIIDPPAQDLEPASVDPEPSPEGRSPPEASSGPPSPAPRNATPPPEPEPVQKTSTPAPPPTPAYTVDRRFGNVTAGAGAASPDGAVCCVGAAPADPSTMQTATVPAGALAFIVEIRWTAPAEQAGFDLDVVLKAPDYREREPDPSDVPPSSTDLYTGHRFAATEMEAGKYARIVVDDAAVLALSGEWVVEISPKGPAAQVPFELALTSVARMPPEADYSAFA